MTESAVEGGRLYVQVVSDTTGFRAQLQRKLDVEMRGVRAKIRAELDTTGIQAQAQAAANAAKQKVKIQAQVEFDRAQIRRELATKLAQAARDIKVRVSVEIDTAAARTQLEAFRREAQRRPITIGLNLNRSQLGTAAAQIGNVLTGLFKMPAILSGIAAAAGGLVNVAGGLYAIVAAASQAVGVLAVLPGLLAAAAQGIGALLFGFSGISGAVKALGQQQKATGAATKKSANQQAAAAEQIKRAQENLKEARKSAAEQVAAAVTQSAQRIVYAEQAISSAQKDQQRAQEDLTKARERAREEIQQLGFSLREASLNEEQAQINLEKAQAAVIAARKNALMTPIGKRQAELDLKQAILDLEEAKDRTKDLTAENIKSAKGGVEGSDTVKAAKENLAAANKQVRDTEKELAAARKEGAKEVAKARADGAKQVANAQRDLAQAIKASKQSAESAAIPVAKMATAFDKLGPSGQRFARFIQSTLVPRIKAMREAVQAELLPRMEKAIKAGLPLLDVLEKQFANTGKTVGDLAIKFGKLAGSKSFTKDTATIMTANDKAIKAFGEGGIYLADALRHVMVIASPLLVRFAKMFKAWAKGRAEAAKLGRENGKMADFFERAWKAGGKLWKIVKDVSAALGNLGKASRPSGDTLLDSLAASAEKFRKATADPANQERIRKFFEGTVPVMKMFGDSLNKIVMFFVQLGEATGGGTLSGLFTVLNGFIGILTAIAAAPGGGEAIQGIFLLSGIGLGLGLVVKILGGLVTNLLRLAQITGLAKLFKWFLRLPWVATAIGKVKAAFLLLRTAIVSATKAALRWMATMIKAAARSVWGGITSAAAAMRSAAAAAWAAARAATAYMWAMIKAGASGVWAGIKTAGAALRTTAAAAWASTRATAAHALSMARLGIASALTATKLALVRAATIAWTVVTNIANLATKAWAVTTALLNKAWLASPIGLVVVAIGLLVAAVIYAWKNFGWFRTAVLAAWDGIKWAAQKAWKYVLKPLFESIKLFFTRVVIPYWKALWTAVKWVWDKVSEASKVAWNKVIKPVFSALADFITKTVPKAFRDGVNAIGKAWNAIRDAAKKPVNFIIGTVYNSGIVPFWNNVMGWLHIDSLKLSKAKLLERGGTITDPADSRPRVTNGPMAIVGEGRRSYPEYVIPTDPRYRGRAQALWSSAGSKLQMLKTGGVLGDVLGGIKKAAGKVVDIGKLGMELLTDPGKVITRMAAPVLDKIKGVGQSPFAQGVAKFPIKMIEQAKNAALDIVKAFNAGFGGDASGVVRAAAKYIGVGDRGGDNMNNPFNQQWGFGNGTPWCANFVSTAIKDAKATKKYQGYPSASVEGYVASMRHVSEGRPGDLGAYRGGGHINIIEKNLGGGMYRTIGGNEGPVVRRGRRGGQSSILRPMARGGVIDAHLSRREAPYAADPRERRNPLTRVMRMLSPNAGDRLAKALTRTGATVGSLNRDSGGPLPPGPSLVNNRTGRNEWVLSPEAIALLGGEKAVAALNASASRVRAGRHTPARPIPQGASATSGGSVVQNIYPQRGQSEYEIGTVAARKLGAMLQ